MSPVDALRVENALLKVRLADLEKALRASVEAEANRARAVTIVEASSQAIFSTGNDGTLLCWNAASERLYGHTTGEAIGRNMLVLVPVRAARRARSRGQACGLVGRARRARDRAPPR